MKAIWLLLVASTAVASARPDEPGAGALAAPSVLRAWSARPASHRLSAIASGTFFRGSDFIYQGSLHSQLGGWLAVDYAPFEWLDAFARAGSGESRNSLGTPTSLGPGTELAGGLRARRQLGPLHLGAVASLLYATPEPQAKGSGLGAAIEGVLTADLRQLNLPLLLHGNAGYRLEPGAAMATRRVGAFPTTAQGLWRYDVVPLALAAEATFRRLTPFVEWSSDLPVGPEAPLAAAPTRLSPGLKLALGGGFSLLAGVEIGLTAAVSEGVPATPPWLGRLAVDFSGLGQVSPPAQQPGPAPPPAPLVSAEVPVPPPVLSAVGTFKGKVTDLEGRPLTAVISFVGNSRLAGKVYEAPGEFEIALEPGAYHAEAVADGYLVRGRAISIGAGETVLHHFQLRVVPVVKTAQLTRQRIEIHQMIQFALDEARILPESFFILDEVVDILLRNPGVTLRIEGHTDESGTADYNQQLSESRAFTVMEYLIDRGVAQERLAAAGFGKTRPLGSNRTGQGRAKNRRVEFKVVEP